ncbi:FAD-binding oxidoreductase [Streptomyces sp. NPDC002018]|uniref:FAD-binding oxidoreductase n=1 Tax=Streptomyces sp. NPDC002018 TaxID=3364629 RepID=UPI0036CA48F2
MRTDRRTVLRLGTSAAMGAALAGATGAASAGAWGGAKDRAPWESLRRRLTGDLVLPPDRGYAQARQSYFSQYDLPGPRGVAYCASVEDVRLCLRFAQDHDLPAVPRGGGHSQAGYSSTRGLVIDMARLRSVTVGRGTVTVGAGAQQIDVLHALSPYGLALVGGTCPTVGVAGYLLGGGYGLLTRGEGMACDRLVSAEVVLADGRVVTCSRTTEPDLFWALRGGGGGNFGIVTRLESTPARLSRLVNFTLSWPWERAAAVLDGWQGWVADGPAELGTILAVALPDAAPGALPVVTVTGAWTGSQPALDRALDQLAARVGAPPTGRTAEALGYRDAMMRWYGCADKSVEQCHRIGWTPEAMLRRGDFLRLRNRMFTHPMPTAGTEALLTAFDADRRAGHGRSITGVSLGGRANELARTDTAYVHRDTRFALMFADTMATGRPGESDRAAAQAWTTALFRAVDRYANGETYQNMPDPLLTDWQRAYYGENHRRLTEVKKQYDPGRFFRFPQAISSTPGVRV